MSEKMYRAAIYVRVSKEDGGKPGSDSVSNQKELVRQFLKGKSDITIVSEMIDDGYSGVFFERPAFLQMLEDIKSGNINCVAVKDLSRLGRNYIEVGRAVTKLFPSYGVRFISVNDNIDSVDERSLSDKLLISFKNLLNDAYCRDISIKIRSQLDVKRKNGDFIGPFAPYGYAKSCENKNRLVIDEYAASVVRDIFRWKKGGASHRAIAEKLNGMGVLSPMEYKKARGLRFVSGFKTNPRAAWSASAVGRILKNEIYTGVLEQGKRISPNYKVKKRVKILKEEWVRVEGTHEPVISAEEFEVVQSLLSSKTRTSPLKSGVYLFAGVTYCGGCGSRMTRKTVPSHGKKYVYFVCAKNKKKLGCSSHCVSVSELENAAIASVKANIDLLRDEKEHLAFIEGFYGKRSEIMRYRRQIAVCRDEAEELKRRILRLREDYESGAIGSRDYSDFMGIYEKKRAAAEDILRKLCDEINVMLKCRQTETAFPNGDCRIPRSLLVSLVSRITVCDKRRIVIDFRFRDGFTSAYGPSSHF